MSTLVTVPVVGDKYFIRIIPVDTTLDKNMPICKTGEYVVFDHRSDVIKRVQPEYPKDLRWAKKEGVVYVKCLVGEDGRVRKVVVLRASADAFVNPSLLPAIKSSSVNLSIHSSFSPHAHVGRRTAGSHTVTVENC